MQRHHKILAGDTFKCKCADLSTEILRKWKICIGVPLISVGYFSDKDEMPGLGQTYFYKVLGVGAF